MSSDVEHGQTSEEILSTRRSPVSAVCAGLGCVLALALLAGAMDWYDAHRGVMRDPGIALEWRIGLPAVLLAMVVSVAVRAVRGGKEQLRSWRALLVVAAAFVVGVLTIPVLVVAGSLLLAGQGLHISDITIG
jgi:hypothetical protein